jgi:hypothetical protein
MLGDASPACFDSLPDVAPKKDLSAIERTRTQTDVKRLRKTDIHTKRPRDCCVMADDASEEAADDAAEDADPALSGERSAALKCSLGRLRITPALRLAIESVATRLKILSARGSLLAAEAVTQVLLRGEAPPKISSQTWWCNVLTQKPRSERFAQRNFRSCGLPLPSSSPAPRRWTLAFYGPKFLNPRQIPES